MKIFDFIKNKIKLNNAPKKRVFLKQLSLLCVIVFMLVSVVWAWFSSSDGTATAEGLSISMGTSDTMLISLNGGTDFVSSINLIDNDEKVQNLIGSYNKLFAEDGKLLLSMQDITSDGKTFLRPKFNEVDGMRIPNTEKEWAPATKNRAYISQDIVFRTSKPSNIYMGKDTAIITSCEVEDKALVSDNPALIGNKSSAGNFSNDCIVGALRISAVDASAQNSPCRFVCIPRSDIELVRNGNTITMLTGDAVSDDTSIHTYYSSTYQTTHDTESDSSAITGFDGTQLITSTSTKVTRDGVDGYEATATVNLWLEGCDPEVTRLLSGGEFKVIFDFLAVEQTS